MRAVDLVLGAVLLAVLVPCVVTDLRERVIPNAITGPGAAAAIALGLLLDPGGEPERLLAGALAGLFLLAAALVNPAGMGMGDVKLIAVIGLCVGSFVIVALFVSLISGVLLGAGVAVTRGVAAARVLHLPFAPFLALGGVAALGLLLAQGGGA